MALVNFLYKVSDVDFHVPYIGNFGENAAWKVC